MKISDLSDCASVALFLAELISIYIDFLTALGSSWWAAVRNQGIRYIVDLKVEQTNTETEKKKNSPLLVDRLGNAVWTLVGRDMRRQTGSHGKRPGNIVYC